jgi:hypothetical protein
VQRTIRLPQLARLGAKIELASAAATEPLAMCGVGVWHLRRVALWARRLAAGVGHHPNTPLVPHFCNFWRRGSPDQPTSVDRPGEKTLVTLTLYPVAWAPSLNSFRSFPHPLSPFFPVLLPLRGDFDDDSDLW